MLIRYQNGDLFEGIILSLQGGVLRVALKDGDDVAEFRLLNGVWLSETCEPVTFDFTMAVLAAVGIVPPGDSEPARDKELTPAGAEPAFPVIPAGYLN
jgi:hypothetical protein